MTAESKTRACYGQQRAKKGAFPNKGLTCDIAVLIITAYAVAEWSVKSLKACANRPPASVAWTACHPSMAECRYRRAGSRVCIACVSKRWQVAVRQRNLRSCRPPRLRRRSPIKMWSGEQSQAAGSARLFVTTQANVVPDKTTRGNA